MQAPQDLQQALALAQAYERRSHAFDDTTRQLCSASMHPILLNTAPTPVFAAAPPTAAAPPRSFRRLTPDEIA
jgi:hypothetical protein